MNVLLCPPDVISGFGYFCAAVVVFVAGAVAGIWAVVKYQKDA